MRKIFLLAILIASVSCSYSQDSCKVKTKERILGALTDEGSTEESSRKPPQLENTSLLWLKKVNEEAHHYRVARVQFRQNRLDSHFALYLGGSAPAYEGNDPGELMRVLNQSSPLPGGSRYYVSFDGFESHKAAGLVQTMRGQQDVIDSSISVEPISTEPGRWSGVVLERVVETRGTEEIREMSERPGWFEGTQRIAQRTAVGVRERLLRAQARSKVALTRFFQSFRKRVEATNHLSSVAEIVNAARAEIKKELGLGNADFKTTIVDQTAGSYIVEIPHVRDLA